VFRILILLLLCVPAVAQKFDAAPGPAPAGYIWQALPGKRAAVLLPAGWAYQVRGAKDSPAYYLTQEPLDEQNDFETGFSLQIVRKATAKTKRAAPEYAEMLMLRAGYGPHRQLLEKSASVERVFHKRTVRYREAPPAGEARVVYQMTLANAKTDTLYLLSFESPEADWEEAWQLGETIIRELVLDSRQ
jgi:hypothetical protein